MKSSISIHLPDDDAWRAGQFIMSGADLPISSRKKFAAIKAFASRRGLFKVSDVDAPLDAGHEIAGIRDYAGANRDGSSGVYMNYVVDPGVYAAFDGASKQLLIADFGSVREASVDEARKWLKSR